MSPCDQMWICVCLACMRANVCQSFLNSLTQKCSHVIMWFYPSNTMAPISNNQMLIHVQTQVLCTWNWNWKWKTHAFKHTPPHTPFKCIPANLIFKNCIELFFMWSRNKVNSISNIRIVPFVVYCVPCSPPTPTRTHHKPKSERDRCIFLPFCVELEQNSTCSKLSYMLFIVWKMNVNGYRRMGFWKMQKPNG